MINGATYRDMIISAANSIDNKKEEINSLNIFPVPDGDTGVNMSLTMQAGKQAVLDFGGTLSDCAEKVASALLRGGRGNSGVILSLFFRGMSKEFKGNESCDTSLWAKAMRGGTESAYKAVRHPTEGTILTVMREATEAAEELCKTEKDMGVFLKAVAEAANKTLLRTPEMLPVLKQANVVDAGGKGFLTILSGMLSVICDGRIISAQSVSQTNESADFTDFSNEDIKFAYCTECIVDKTSDIKLTNDDIENFKSFIMGMGDSGVFIDDDEFMKFHIHTNDPGKVLSECIRYGVLAKVKIENMKAQHTSMAENMTGSSVEKPEKKAPEKKYGFVSVAAGEGIVAVFKDLGADYVVEGGQTMNPSTDDIINAINQTPSEVVFVLHNNKNIYMAAKQAEELVEDKKVIVLKTVSVPQGITAMLTFDENSDVDTNKDMMKEGMKSVRTEKMTFAARDSVFENTEIKAGQILGLVENTVRFVEDDRSVCMKKLAEEISDAAYVTLFYGEDTTEEEAEKMAGIIRETIGPDKEVAVVNGGQPVYYYMLSAE